MNENKSIVFLNQLNTMMGARICVWVITPEEQRFLTLFRKIANARNNSTLKIYSWSITEGLLNLTDSMIAQNNIYKNPEKVQIQSKNSFNSEFGNSSTQNQDVLTFADTYEYILNNSSNKIYILKDIHNILESARNDYAQNVRRVKDLIFYVRDNEGFLLFISNTPKICSDFEKDVQILPMPRPDEKDINKLLDDAIIGMSKNNNFKLDIPYVNEKNKRILPKHPNGELIRDKIIQNIKGLTETEIMQVLAYIGAKNKGLEENCIQEIKDSKKQLIEKSGALKYIEVPNQITVGGHDVFKNYIQERGLYLNKKIREQYKLKAPKGVLLVGVSGAGKSLLARYVGFTWNIPIIRLNFDAVFGKYLGESETNLNEALNIAEANSPCILWIDEIEKALGGVGSGDSGTGLRILGKILTWMQERKEMVFMFATANNISKLPSELLRAGRFDALFWADLPSVIECKDIFGIKTKENGFELNFLDLMQLAHKAYDKLMTGAEIEEAVIQSVYAAAIESSKKDTIIPITSEMVNSALDNINSTASSNSVNLKIDREKALKNYIFTSKESYDKIKSDLNKKNG